MLNQPMKLKELLHVLRLLDGELHVIVEGCDCIGEVFGVEVQGNAVLLQREPGGLWLDEKELAEVRSHSPVAVLDG